jgi:hypothetical protein
VRDRATLTYYASRAEAADRPGTEQGDAYAHVRTVVVPHNPSGALFQRSARRAPTPRLHALRPKRETTVHMSNRRRVSMNS